MEELEIGKAVEMGVEERMEGEKGGGGERERRKMEEGLI